MFLLTWYSFEEFGAEELKPQGGGPNRPITFWYALYIIYTIVLLLFVMKDFVLDIKDLHRAEMIKQVRPSIISLDMMCVVQNLRKISGWSRLETCLLRHLV